ncbi:MAG: hypothetical protein COB78_01175 [Hyphomicrobiales bacterium]|nr:MAG: hypothetical protein COB78_01175 [Hyphomicrobiales bacterium]
MPLLPPVNSIAVQVLQQSRIAPIAVDKNASSENNLISALNNVKTDEIDPTEDFWDINKVTPTQMKLHIFEKVGEKFGLDQDDFNSFSRYAAAIAFRMEKMKEEDPAGAMIFFHEIEKELGLDELGISLEEVVEAMMEPGGKADQKLDAALKAKADEINGELLLEDGKDKIFGSLKIDSNGLYNVFG